jgi:hypothetical protein
MRKETRIALTLALSAAACWRIGEPTESAALVTWAAYPDTVVVGEVFSFEFAGPVAPDACGRLDTAIVRVEDDAIHLSGRRSVYDTMCADSPVSFYEARPLTLERAGRYRITTSDGADLGALVALDSGSFSPMRATGEGTVMEAGGCLLFGPGWVGNQRPFALRGADAGVRAESDTGRRIRISGTLSGYTLCGSFGSRPVISVESATVTESTVREYYDQD